MICLIRKNGLKKWLGCVLALLLCFFLSIGNCSTASAASQPINAVRWFFYGQSAIGEPNNWSSSFQTGQAFNWYNGYKLRLNTTNYSANGEYINFDYSILFSSFNISGIFEQRYPLVLEACSLGGKQITFTSNSSTWTTPGSESGLTAAITGAFSGKTTGTASGMLVCDYSGVNGHYVFRPGEPPAIGQWTIKTAKLNIDSYGSENDMVNAQQLEQLTNVNTNLAIVNQAINNQSQQQADRWEEEDRKEQELENSANESVNKDESPDMSAQQNNANGYFDIFTTLFANVNQQGSCKLPEISAFGFSLGELDLCTFAPPSWLRTALGAVATIAVAACGIKVTKRIINIAMGGLN